MRRLIGRCILWWWEHPQVTGALHDTLFLGLCALAAWILLWLPD